MTIVALISVYVLPIIILMQLFFFNFFTKTVKIELRKIEKKMSKTFK